MITTTRGNVEESELLKTEIVFDDEDKKIVWVEYCEKDCDGVAHLSKEKDTETYFCGKHIHHSVSVTIKKGLSLFPEAGSFQ